MASIMKASQVISSEIELETLIETLIKIAIENAGAQKGFLITPQNGEFIIEAKGRLNENIVSTQYLPFSKTSDSINTYLPMNIIHYVARTQKNIVLGNATEHEQFTQDIYINTHQSKSILCVPLIYKKQLNSILYLENNLISNAFTSENVKILQLLASQMAISLDNAKLYTKLKENEKRLANYNESLEQQVTERTKALSNTLEKLKHTQKQLVEAEKMAALGGLVAGVAHEINTPLGIGISMASMLAYKTNETLTIIDTDKIKGQDIKEYLQTASQSSELILNNLQRAADLIQSFKTSCS